MPRISVILPTYNRAASLCEAIDSVLAQTRKADEIVVVDDGSTDDTAERLRAYGDAITVIRQDNQGVGVARNTAIGAATGEWITFIDSDDLWYSNRLAVLERDIADTGAGVHVANLVFTGSGYETELFALRSLDFPKGGASLVQNGVDLALAYVSPDGVAIRKEWLTRAGGFDPAMRMHGDSHLLFRLSTFGPWLATSDIVASARRLEEQYGFPISHQARTKPAFAAAMKVKLFSDFAEDSALSPGQRDIVLRRLSRSLVSLAHAEAIAGDVKAARRSLLRSAKEHPSIKGWIRIMPPLLLGSYGYGLIQRQSRLYR